MAAVVLWLLTAPILGLLVKLPVRRTYSMSLYTVNMPPILSVNLEMPDGTLNNSMEYILQISIPSEENSTKSEYRLSSDYVGAMWFTVAVVLVYGVGTIGLLGITARRNRAMELMDREVNAYLKSKFSGDGWAASGRKQIRVKKPVYELIRTSDSNGHKEIWALKTTEDLNMYQPASFYRKPKPKLIRAKTWAGNLSKTESEMKNTEIAVNPTFGPLPAIVENELQEDCENCLDDADLQKALQPGIIAPPQTSASGPMISTNTSSKHSNTIPSP